MNLWLKKISPASLSKCLQVHSLAKVAYHNVIGCYCFVLNRLNPLTKVFGQLWSDSLVLTGILLLRSVYSLPQFVFQYKRPQHLEGPEVLLRIANKSWYPNKKASGYLDTSNVMNDVITALQSEDIDDATYRDICREIKNVHGFVQPIIPYVNCGYTR